MSNRGLLIGGVQSRLSTLEESLQEVGWKVDSYLKPIDAIKRIRAKDYGAIFCDERLKGATAAGLLVGVKRLNAKIPFYLFSESMDPARFSSSGKPTALLRFPPIPAQIPLPKGTQEINPGQKKVPLKGNTSMVSIIDIIEMMGYTKQNAIMEFDFGKIGQIYLNNGKIEHAIFTIDKQAAKFGLNALGELLAIEDCEFRVVDYNKPNRLTVNMPNSTAMTEASRRSDETQRYKDFVAQVIALCPEVIDISVGYLLSDKPYTGFGNSIELFDLAKVIIKANRDAIKLRIDNLFLTTEKLSYSIKSFKEDTIIIASAPANLNDELGQAVRKAYSDVFSSK